MTSKDPVRERLLAVASDLFARNGYDAVSVRDITSRAKANLGAITYHFGSKEALFHAVVAMIAEPLVAAVSRSAQGSGSALNRIETVIRTVGEHLQANPWAPRVMLRELASGRPLPPPMMQAWKSNIGTLMGLVMAGQQDGSIRPGDPLLLTLSVVGQVFFFRISSRIAREVAGVDPADPAVRARISDHIAETVRRSIANHPKVPS
jgi:TetR/AcrR family transcriptional regulator, regulator of cefoperazone and chloramphenicol sensitivity